MQGFASEVALWRQLSHPNVLPFFGVYHWHGLLCLVSPWMKAGNVNEFLEQFPRANRLNLVRIARQFIYVEISKNSQVLDIARGLEYLHQMDPNVVHGDLKGVRIFNPATLAYLTVSRARKTYSLHLLTAHVLLISVSRHCQHHWSLDLCYLPTQARAL
jgi:serine/threonine protein kinase